MRVSKAMHVSTIAIIALVGGLVHGVGGADQSYAANAAAFDPGYIIDDALFYNGTLMPEAAIQSFLVSKEAGCAPTVGNPGCMKDYLSDSASRVADAYCAAYAGGVAEPASRILFKIAIACNISPKVLLVILQKEQSLVTAINPTALKYQKAMGYGCPDSSVCDARYYGFANQVYSAAWQFQYYKANPTRFIHRAGSDVTIRWNPNTACGTSVVYIKNAATAGLYNYTPYRPNQAALNNLGGLGDGCSSYGNRNFWAYFTDWFGPTTVSPAAAAFVKSLYTDIMGRGAGPAEIEGWGQILMLGRPAVHVAAGFINSDEYRLIRIRSAYENVLDRPAEPAAGPHWLDLMRRGVVATDDVDRTFYGTDEYLKNSGGTNETFVAALYQDLIGRAAGPEEITGWSIAARDRGRESVVGSIWYSVETARSRVIIMYETYLGRTPQQGESEAWARLAIAQGDPIVRWAIIGSGEYWTRAGARFPA